MSAKGLNWRFKTQAYKSSREIGFPIRGILHTNYLLTTRKNPTNRIITYTSLSVDVPILASELFRPSTGNILPLQPPDSLSSLSFDNPQ